MERVAELKKLIYDTLTLGNDESDTQDISLVQKMGLNMTKAVSKNGIHLVQIQSVIDRKIAFNLVKVLKILDDCEAIDVLEVKQLPEVENSLTEHIAQLASQGISLKEFQKRMKKMYALEVLRQSDSMTDAAEKLKITRPYLSILKNKKEIKMLES